MKKFLLNRIVKSACHLKKRNSNNNNKYFLCKLILVFLIVQNFSLFSLSLSLVVKKLLKCDKYSR